MFFVSFCYYSDSGILHPYIWVKAWFSFIFTLATSGWFLSDNICVYCVLLNITDISSSSPHRIFFICENETKIKIGRKKKVNENNNKKKLTFTDWSNFSFLTLVLQFLSTVDQKKRKTVDHMEHQRTTPWWHILQPNLKNQKHQHIILKHFLSTFSSLITFFVIEFQHSINKFSVNIYFWKKKKKWSFL